LRQLAYYLPPTHQPPVVDTRVLSGGAEPLALELACPDVGAVAGLAAALRESGEGELARRPVVEIVGAIDAVAERWLDQSFPARVEAEEWLPRVTGYASETIRAALDDLFAGLRADALWGLIEEELGDREALDRFVTRRRFSGRYRVFGPRLTVVSCAGNIPVASLPSIVHCLLVKSGCLIRVSRAEPLLPALFARSLSEEAPWLAGCLAAVWWAASEPVEGSRFKVQSLGDVPASDLEPADEGVQEAVIGAADAWIAYGAEATVAEIRRRLPERVLFQAHGHRIGFAVVARERLEGAGLERVAAEAAHDIVMFDQQGCVSPRVFFVEEGGRGAPLGFARAVAERLEALREALPRRRPAPEEAGAVHQQRTRVEMRRLTGEPVELFRSASGTEWTVIYDPSADLSTPGSDRTAIIRPVPDLGVVPVLLAPYRTYLQTAAISASDSRWPQIVEALAKAGATRLCPLGRTQSPSPGWHHDGRPCLADLVRWVDWEVTAAAVVGRVGASRRA
jgi:hypothetical protein